MTRTATVPTGAATASPTAAPADPGSARARRRARTTARTTARTAARTTAHTAARTTARVVASVVVATSLAACGNGGGEDVASDASASTPTCPFAPTEAPAPAGATKELSKKPVIAASKAPKPTELLYSDIVVGKGAEAKTGDAVEVKYVGAIYETGKEFDSSWSRGPDETLKFGICRTEVVPGFAVGPTGMKVGGRRQIVLPPQYAYGKEGRPPTIPANSTLVFVVDLVKVG